MAINLLAFVDSHFLALCLAGHHRRRGLPFFMNHAVFSTYSISSMSLLFHLPAPVLCRDGSLAPSGGAAGLLSAIP